jgi:hypothetical protein
VSPFIISSAVPPTSLKYECLVDRNADNDEPEDPVQQTFFGELQRIVRLDLPKSATIHQPQDETVLLTHVRTCDAIENEDGFWEYSTLKPSPHFMDLNTVVCVVGRVRDRGGWTFIDRSGPTVRVEMAGPPSSSQCSDVTDFSTSEESESDSDSGSSSEGSPTSDSSVANGIPMDLDTSSEGSSESL